jgi:ParB/RepB/Spo0J family partition protein
MEKKAEKKQKEAPESPPENDIVMVPVDKIEPAPLNPNKQKPGTFNCLVQSVEESGCDENIIVFPHPDKKKRAEGFYQIVAGEHRWKASKVAGLSHVPCSIKEKWDVLKARMEIVKRNVTRGELDNTLFTKLVNQIIKEEDLSVEVIAKMMGFESYAKFAVHYIETSKKEKQMAKALKSMAAAAEKKTSHIDNLSLVLNMLITNFGDTLPGDFMYFLYRKKLHLYVRLDKEGKKAVDLLTAYFTQILRADYDPEIKLYSGENINSFLLEAIERELDRRDVNVTQLLKTGRKKKKKMAEKVPVDHS